MNDTTWRIEQIHELIDSLLKSNVEKEREHGLSLCGKRTRGSTTEHDIYAVPKDRVGEFFVPKSGYNPECLYLRFQAPELKGRVGVMTLDVADDTGYLDLVRVRKAPGNHGYELFVSQPEACLHPLDMIETEWITVILGPADETGQRPLWTWFPGEPFAPLDNMTAVKMHNGR